jgi:hypothetical protein
VDLDRSVNSPAVRGENLADLMRTNAVHESFPYGGESRLAQVLLEDRADLLAYRAQRYPSREPPRPPERSERHYCVANQEPGAEVGAGVALEILLDGFGQGPAVDVGLAPHQIPRV